LKNTTKQTFILGVTVSLWFIFWTTEASINPVLPELKSDDINIKGFSVKDTIDDDTLKYPFDDYTNNPYENSDVTSPLEFSKPSNITTDVEYDPETGNFIITEKIGDLEYRPPYVMTFDEYNEYKSKSEMRSYWRQRLAYETDVDATGNNLLDDYLKQSLNVGIKGFDKIFGTNEISITPTGSATLTFGIKYYKAKNPSLPLNMQRNFNFDFDEDIKMGVSGQIGDKMSIGINYDTEATFDFENQTSIEYVGKEDEIIQKIEAGDVSMPLNNTLIPGSSTLFGFLTELKFGKLTVTTVASQQKGESDVIEVDGGAVVTDFEIKASDYEEGKHFFLAHYFRDNYETSLKALPLITSGYTITRIEVWITNETGDYQDSRNIIAFLDLGENEGNIHAREDFIQGDQSEQFPNNASNNLYQKMNDEFSGIRDVTSVSALLNPLKQQYGFTEGQDYVKLENARKLSSSEFTFNEDLGYLSLNSSVREDAILAVSIEYTISGQTYKIGEFSNGDIDAPQTIITKLLKGPSMTPALPNWDLMMKNVYALGAWDITSEDFSLEIMYNNDALGTPTIYIPEGDIGSQRLLSVMNLDNTDNQLNQYPDGYFDFIEGITVNSSNGRIYFPVLEPFGEFLRNEIGDEAIADKYVYEELYDSTKYRAEQIAEKNKFYLKGSYKSSGGSQIYLNAFNIPEGSVQVSAGAVQLVENVDYVVDYSLGRVSIINQAYLTPGTPIKISLESNSLFNIKTKNLVGSHFDYRFNEDINLGATIMNLTEKPNTYKVSIGDEPTSNTIWGLNGAYSKEVPLITKAVDLLPFIETKEKSTISITAEFAQLVPGNSRAIGKSGTAYIDDFEGSQTYMDMKSPQAWVLASTPMNQNLIFPEADSLSLAYGYNRAKLAWYSVTPDLQEKNTNTPSHITVEDLRNHYVREIFEQEIFKNKRSPNNIPARLSVLNLAYYPDERGPYNFDIEGIDEEGNLIDPETRWGGIMRQIQISDFESSNVEFIEFWLMDPYIYDSSGTSTGELYFNLGDISEDVLKDGKKSYENGIPYPSDADLIDSTIWGLVSRKQQLTQVFANDEASRQYQDVGFDGLRDEDEINFHSKYLQLIRTKFAANPSVYNKFVEDPAGDNFHFFFGDDYDQQELSILDRYKEFNGIDGNSPISENNSSAYTSISMYPDIEDVNMDNTLDVYENYFQYKILIDPDEMIVGQNYITSVVEAALSFKDGTKDTIKWYQFKIPINEPDEVLGNISDFKSIRFMRLFLRGFNDDIILRFAKLDLVRSDWRKYDNSLTEGGEGTTFPQIEDGTFDVSVVNIEESSTKTPVNYVLPPGITREYSPLDPQLRELNEQALSMKVIDLPDGEARAVYKNINMDLRKYKKIKMFIHAEALESDPQPVDDYEVTVFVRFGADFKENYYEYEIPVRITPDGTYIGTAEDAPDRLLVWPEQNNLDLVFEIFQDAKQQRNEAMREDGSTVRLNLPYIVRDGDKKIIVMGNPNLSNVKTMMIGIRNPNANNNNMSDDGLPKSVEIWINELRLTDFNEDGGWAANARFAADLADFGDVAVEGYTHTPGFGSLEQKVNERYKDQVYEYYLSSNFELGKFFPQKYGINIPLYFGFSESRTNPEYNPLDPDILLKTTLNSSYYSEAEKDSIRNVSQEFVQRKNINLTNVSIAGNSTKTKSYPWDINKWTSSFSYSEVFSRDVNTEFDIDQNLTASLNYNYSITPKNIVPFKKTKIFGKNLPAIIKEFNFYYVPSLVAFSAIINRQYNTHKTRDVSSYGIELPITYQKDFLWSRTYDLTHKLSKNLKVTFSAANSSRVNPQGLAESRGFLEKYGYQPQDTIFHEFYNLGYNTDYLQDFDVAWTTPINKLPLLGWTSLTANYTATYDWIRGSDPVGVEDEETGLVDTIDFGNSIQNSRTIKLTGRLAFTTLYSKVKYLKTVQNRFTEDGRKPIATKYKEVTYSSTARLKEGISKSVTHNLKTDNITEVIVTDADGNVVDGDYEVVDKNKIKFTSKSDVEAASITVNGKKEQNENIFLIASDYTLFSLMALQNVNITYQDNAGILMNGFSPDAKILGMDKVNNSWAPGGDFIFGEQDPRFLMKAYTRGWLVNQTDTSGGYYNEPYSITNEKDLNINATIEPINNLSIKLTFDRYIAFYESDYTGINDAGDFEIQTKLITGNYMISYNTIKTAFWKIDTTSSRAYYSKAFSNMLSNRVIIAQRMANEREGIYPGYDATPVPGEYGPYYPDGYSRNSQDVLIASFLAAYSGQSPDKVKFSPFPQIPLPDWNITFEGLKNLPLIKDYVSSFIITHNYLSTYTVGDFSSNPEYNFDEFENNGLSSAKYDATGMFIPQYEITSVSINEKFNPLIGVDITWSGTLSTKLEYNKSRNMLLNFNSNRIEETHNEEFVMGVGYKFAQLPLNIKTGGEVKHFQSDLVIRVDFTISDMYVLYRRIEEQFSEPYILNKNFTLTSTADYTLNERFNVQFYYNHSFGETITSYPITNMEFGFKVQFALIP
jgi:cell surface protein SprA